MKTEDIGVVIPAYNEEMHLGDTLKALKKLTIIKDILVVDDGSQDRTGDIAKQHGVKLLTLKKNHGKGHALKKGLDYLNNSIIVFLDADVGDTAQEITKLIYPLLVDEADVTIGKVDFTPGKGGVGLVKALSQIAFKSLTGTECVSVLSGQRAFKRDVMHQNFLSYKGFGIEFGMTVDLAKSNLRILEVPVDIKHRVTGRDYRGFKHRSKQFRDILIVVLNKKIKTFYSREANQ